MKIGIRVDVAAAIKNGIACSNKSVIRVSSGDLQSLTQEERDLLANNLEYCPDNTFDRTYKHEIRGDKLRDIINDIKERKAKKEAEQEQEKQKKAIVLQEAMRELERLNSLSDAEIDNEWSRFSDVHYALMARLNHGIGPAIESLDESKEFRQRVSNAIEKRKVADEAKREEELAEESRVRAMYELDRREWIVSSGSERLKRMLAEDIELNAAYLGERLMSDLGPGWYYYSSIPGSISDPRNPPEEAFDMLDLAREKLPDAELKFYERLNCYVAYAEFLGKAVVFSHTDLEADEIEEDEDE